ncbi:MAG: hypothetical protein NTZ74_15310 [Chloroflexi bacterium]|nr:hypothetical protein [Chloroflexota bacterium]
MIQNLLKRTPFRSILIVITLATLPCYLIGMVVLWVGNSVKSHQTFTPTFLSVTTEVPTGESPTLPIPTLQFPTSTLTATPTLTIPPSLTPTYFIPSNTPSETPTLTPTETPTETITPSIPATETVLATSLTAGP